MIEQIFLSVAVFSGLVLMLVLILNFAESKLLPQGDVTIEINGDSEKNIKTRPGSTLLSVLAGQSVFLPSACGGGGTCAMCECQVMEGGGEILPTETGHISRSKAKENWRLACQVKIKDNMIVEKIVNNLHKNVHLSSGEILQPLAIKSCSDIFSLSQR